MKPAVNFSEFFAGQPWIGLPSGSYRRGWATAAPGHRTKPPARQGSSDSALVSSSEVEVLTKLDHSHREVLTQDKKQDNDDQDSTEADIHINLHRAADPLRGCLSVRQ